MTLFWLAYLGGIAAAFLAGALVTVAVAIRVVYRIWTVED